jgi:hypothetical protein
MRGCSPNGLLQGAIAYERQSAFSSVICVNDGLGWAAAIRETAEDEMKIRISGMLSQ